MCLTEILVSLCITLQNMVKRCLGLLISGPLFIWSKGPQGSPGTGMRLVKVDCWVTKKRRGKRLLWLDWAVLSAYSIQTENLITMSKYFQGVGWIIIWTRASIAESSWYYVILKQIWDCMASYSLLRYLPACWGTLPAGYLTSVPVPGWDGKLQPTEVPGCQGEGWQKWEETAQGKVDHRQDPAQVR